MDSRRIKINKNGPPNLRTDSKKNTPIQEGKNRRHLKYCAIKKLFINNNKNEHKREISFKEEETIKHARDE